jgi:UDP-GlcNAc3NAcA epimerase
MRIFTIIGARPQFVKASVVSMAFMKHNTLEEVLIHTGQHFDANMSNIFFDQLGIPRPEYQLDIHGGGHGDMTGRMLMALETIFIDEKPDMVLVYGDTNSTLAGALTAAKLHIPVCHVEAGLRSFNMDMPEEVKRILTDRISSILFCSTQTALDNLSAEGYPFDGTKMVNAGDVMQDSAHFFSQRAQKPDAVESDKNNFILTTLHRAENTDDINRLTEIIEALNTIHNEIMPMVIPLHPRTRSAIHDAGLKLDVDVIEPVGYLEMLWLLKHCQMVLTDSGGLQKEAFFFSKPCVTVRDQTEWVELVENGSNVLASADKRKIVSAVMNMIDKDISDPDNLYGGGQASNKIADYLANMI